jgi:hypothetical protein
MVHIVRLFQTLNGFVSPIILVSTAKTRSVSGVRNSVSSNPVRLRRSFRRSAYEMDRVADPKHNASHIEDDSADIGGQRAFSYFIHINLIEYEMKG